MILKNLRSPQNNLKTKINLLISLKIKLIKYEWILVKVHNKYNSDINNYLKANN